MFEYQFLKFNVWKFVKHLYKIEKYYNIMWIIFFSDIYTLKKKKVNNALNSKSSWNSDIQNIDTMVDFAKTRGNLYKI